MAIECEREPVAQNFGNGAIRRCKGGGNEYLPHQDLTGITKMSDTPQKCSPVKLLNNKIVCPVRTLLKEAGLDCRK